MDAVGDAELLAVWERGLGRPLPYRGLLLLTAWAGPLPAPAEGLSVGRRDALLLVVRRRLFGPAVATGTACPACSELAEVEFALDDVRAEPPAEPCGTATADGVTARWRLPTCGDLLGLTAEPSPERAARWLLEQCLVEVRRGEAVLAPAECPRALAVAVAAAMARADPQADVKLALACPVCGRAWQVTFDILSYLWQELDDRARELLGEVHRLAAAYGWGEAEILALTPQRRQAYLEILDG
jgi:hypothetical protein